MKYYVCTFSITPNYCETFQQTVVLSEHPLFVIKREKGDKYVKYIILFCDEIDEKLYFSSKNLLNPEKDGSYLSLKNSDYKKLKF